MLILAELRTESVEAALEALRPFVTGAPRLLQAVEPRTPSTPDPDLVRRIFEAIQPTDKQPMRREVLRALYSGHDTMLDQGGRPDPTFRNGTAALSRALRPFTLAASPLDILFTRERRLVTHGPYKGRYEATSYLQTALGQAVGESLRAAKVIK